MSNRNSRKKNRKLRNRLRGSPTPSDKEGRNRWQGSISFQLGKDPRTKLDINWSGVPIPVDNLEDIEGVVELTELARKPPQEEN